MRPSLAIMKLTNLALEADEIAAIFQTEGPFCQDYERLAARLEEINREISRNLHVIAKGIRPMEVRDGVKMTQAVADRYGYVKDLQARAIESFSVNIC